MAFHLLCVALLMWTIFQGREASFCANDTDTCDRVSQTCQDANGGNNFTCACKTGYRSVGEDCYDPANPFLLLTSSYNDGLYFLDLVAAENISRLNIPNIRNPVAIDYGPLQKRVYWSDVVTDQPNVIRSASLDGKDVTTLLTLNNAQISGLAVDSPSGLLFYADWQNNLIGVITLSNVSRGVIFMGLKPRDVDVDPINGVLYWTEWNSPKIARANYDGSAQTTLITLNANAQPNGIALDLKGNHLYWVDAYTGTVESSDLNGGSRVAIYTFANSRIFGLAFFQSILYVTDWGLKNVTYLYSVSLPTNGSSAVELASGNFLRMNGVCAYSDSQTILVPNGCSSNNGNCSHFCFPTPSNGYKCSCPIGMELRPDTRTCKEVELQVTISGETDGSGILNLTCDPGNKLQYTELSWDPGSGSFNFLSVRGNNLRIKPIIPTDDGRVIRCTVVYSNGLTQTASYTIQLTSGPGQSPASASRRDSNILLVLIMMVTLLGPWSMQ